MQKEFNMLGTISEDEIQEFNNLIESFNGEIADIEFIEGFLTAQACAPEMVPMDDFIPLIMDDSFEFSDEETVSKFFQYLFSLQNLVQETLSESKPSADDMFVPYCLKEADEDGILGVFWATGFMAAFTSFPDISDPIMNNEETKMLIAPFIAIAGQNHPDENLRAEPIPKGEEDEYVSAMFASVTVIYNFLKENNIDLPDDAPIQPITLH